MRLMIDTLIALLAVAVLSTVLVAQHRERRELGEFDAAHRALASLHQELVYQAALGEVTLTATGFPQRLDPGWFGHELPVNPLAPPPDWPWADVAAEGDRHDHPPDPVLVEPGQAGFWYNPNRGIVRLRVPEQLSRQRTLELYNALNNSALERLPDRGARQERAAAQTLHATPGRVYVSGGSPSPAPSRPNEGRRKLGQPDG